MNELNILGTHNYENVMAATGMALSLGVPMDKIVEVLKRFQAVEHRIEYVTERGVKFITTLRAPTDAAIKGICAMNRPTLLIGGGYDKQSEYDEWIESFGGKVKLLVLIGQTRRRLQPVRGHMDLRILCSVIRLRRRSTPATGTRYPVMRYSYPLHVQAGECLKL